MIEEKVPALPISVAMLPSEVDNIELQAYTHSSTGSPAKAPKLLKIVLARLNDGVCIFVFRKKDGAYRKSIGTRKVALIPGKLPETATVTANDVKTPFYDLQEMAWKSFQNDSIVAVIIF